MQYIYEVRTAQQQIIKLQFVLFCKQNMVIRYCDQMSCIHSTLEKLYKPCSHKNHCSLCGDADERLVFSFVSQQALIMLCLSLYIVQGNYFLDGFKLPRTTLIIFCNTSAKCCDLSRCLQPSVTTYLTDFCQVLQLMVTQMVTLRGW